MSSSCKKCWGQIIFEKWKKYSKCKYCWFQNYYSIYNEIWNKNIIIFLIFFIVIILLLSFYYLGNKKTIINNWEINNYNSSKVIIKKETVIKYEDIKKDNNIDFFNCTNKESTRRYKLNILTKKDQILKSESNFNVAFDSNNILNVKLYYLIWEEKNWKWVTEKQEKMTEMNVYWSTYNQTPTNYTLVAIPKKIDWKIFKIVAYWFDEHFTCKVRVVSDQKFYVKPYFDLSNENFWKNIDLVVDDIFIYDKKRNNLWKSFSKDKIIYYVPVIKNIWLDSVNFNFDTLKFSIHSNNWDLTQLNWSSKCSDTNVILKPWELYYCFWDLESWWYWFYKENNKKISIGIDYWDNIKETNENNNIWTIFINITD